MAGSIFYLTHTKGFLKISSKCNDEDRKNANTQHFISEQ